MHEWKGVLPVRRCGGAARKLADSEELRGAEIGSEMERGGAWTGTRIEIGIEIGSEHAGEAREESCMSRELRARGAFAWAGVGSRRGIALHCDGMRGRRVSEYVAATGISDYDARCGADRAYCDVSMGYAR